MLRRKHSARSTRSPDRPPKGGNSRDGEVAAASRGDYVSPSRETLTGGYASYSGLLRRLSRKAHLMGKPVISNFAVRQALETSK